MTTPRDYAASLGLAKAGARGRLSTAAKDAIAKAKAGGMVFDDPTYVVKRAESKPRPVVTDKAPADNVNNFAATPDPNVPTGTFWSYKNDKDKPVKVNGRQVCMNCQVSLDYHSCNTPQAVTKDGIQRLSVVYGRG